MRVLLAHKYFYNLGGAEVFVFETAKALKSAGHEVAYFSTKSKENHASEYEQFFVQNLEFRNKSFIQNLFHFKNILHNSEAETNFEKLIDEFKPDIINVFGFYGHLSPSIILAARKRNIKIVFTCNDYKHICTNYKLYHHGKICNDCKLGGPKMAAINKCCHNSLSLSVASSIEAYYYQLKNIYDVSTSHFNFASQFMADTTMSFWPDRNLKYSIVRNPFDLEKYANVQLKNGSYFLYFGRLVEEKGVDQLIKAFQKLGPPYSLKIVGSGEQEAELKNYCSQNSLSNIEFLGPLWGEKLNPVVEEAIAVCVPSRWHENYPYVICEAFAHRKAVLGSQRGGIPEMVTQGITGFLYDPESVDSICGALREAQNSIGSLEQMGKNGFSWLKENLNYTKFTRDLIQSYSEALS